MSLPSHVRIAHLIELRSSSGQDDELPELIFGASRLHHIDVSESKIPILPQATASGKGVAL